MREELEVQDLDRKEGYLALEIHLCLEIPIQKDEFQIQSILQ